ncbi:MAG: acylphosphatase [Ignavibacteriales bacterium]|nr:acylphosphatase [Ignavibacteriales bacterium]
MRLGVHIVVKGLVQGVGFRFFVHRQALSLCLTGQVRNLYNGDVEIEAFGERSMLEEFVKEVKVGPRAAHVVDIKIEWKEDDPSKKGFEVR